MNKLSIYETPFYNKPPVPKWLYSVDICEFDNVLEDAITNITWSKREMQKLETYARGIKNTNPGKVENGGELNIKFNENVTMRTSKMLDSIFPMNDNFYNDLESYYKDDVINKTITVYLYEPDVNINNSTKPKKTLKFYGCWLISIDSIESTNDNVEGVMELQARFSFNYMKVSK